jgi:hypothetical protein
MTAHRIILAAALVFAAGAACAQDSFAGVWRITAAFDTSGSSPAFSRIVGKTIDFEPDAVTGPAPLACAGARYETVLMAAEGLFQGALPETQAIKVATGLGMAREIETLRVDCDTGSFDYHAAGDRLAIMLDNVIYLMDRPR